MNNTYQPLSRTHLNDNIHKINQKEIYKRNNYNIMTAEQYYNMLFISPIKPLTDANVFEPHNNSKYPLYDDYNNILDKKIIIKRHMEHPTWFLAHDFNDENIYQNHLPPKYYIPL